ncbi:hypothetical protein A9Q81_12325 [Gammaproteobacteria bacterium 42_54_T18]|nr:hypothetical protein A9Q81_12325 [Gammaproteobacteria bacterium 42_54_T18]
MNKLKHVKHTRHSTALNKADGAGTVDAVDAGFFLPDLCEKEAVFFLVVVSELFSLVLILAFSSLAAFDWNGLALVSLFVQWVALSSAAILCKLRPYLAKMPANRAVVLSYLVIPVDAWVFSFLSQWVLARSATDEISFFSPDILTNVVIAAIMGGLVIRYFYLQAQLLARRQSELIHKIQALQSRIRPHFLFNSMNSIVSLIGSDPEKAEEAVLDLSELFRASLNEVGNQVPFQQEVQLCKRYLGIESLRFGERLHVEWDMPDIPDGVQIPLLTLQPLLENAILHGIQPLPDGGVIRVNAIYHYGLFELQVSNPWVEQETEAQTKGNQMALENTRNRLSVLYGDRAKLTSYQENGRYITIFSYPYEL